MKKIGCFHFDLDGVVSAILLDHVCHFDKILKGGYHKAEEMVSKVPVGSHLIVSDYVLSAELYKKLHEKCENVIILDHHPATLELKTQFPGDKIYYSDSKSASLLCYETLSLAGVKFPKQFKDLALYANAYDLYKRVDDKENFNVGYDLNQLFWKYMFDDFMNRFDHGFDGFTEEEEKFLNDTHNRINKQINESAHMPYLGENINSLISVCTDPNIINDIPYHKMGFDVYFIVTKYKNSLGISLRAGTSSIILNGFTKEIEKEKGVISSGGHEQACGITLSSDLSDKEILDIVIKYHNYLDNHKRID